MPILFACPCGRKIRAKDGTAGRVISCPACGQRLQVPAPDAVDLGINTDDQDADLDFSAPLPTSAPADAPPARFEAPSSPVRRRNYGGSICVVFLQIIIFLGCGGFILGPYPGESAICVTVAIAGIGIINAIQGIHS